VAVKFIVANGYSRIPIYKETIDNIVGVVYAKDIIIYPEKDNIATLMRNISFVTENMKIQSLMNMFQSKKRQIAIVVDEYGVTSGLVTLEDILEELVGEIMDEYDDEMPEITKINDNNWLFSGKVQIAQINSEFGLSIDEEFDNIAEFLFAKLKHIPKKNEKFIYNETTEFIIVNIKNQRINTVKMKILDNKEV
jgi:CBS domain containing-hemolysin-like protein